VIEVGFKTPWHTISCNRYFLMRNSTILTIVCALLAAGCSSRQKQSNFAGSATTPSYEMSSSDASATPKIATDTTTSEKNVPPTAQGQLNNQNDSFAQGRIYSNATDSVTGLKSNQSTGNNLSPTSDRPNSPTKVYPDSTTSVPDTTQTPNVNDQLNANIQGVTEADRAVVQQLTQELKSDSSIAPLMSDVKVTIDNGKATLTGTVKSADDKTKIEEALQRIGSITSVDDQLQTSSVETTTDQK